VFRSRCSLVQLANLEFVEKPNPRSKKLAPMHLYSNDQLEELSHAKWGGHDGLQAERVKRAHKREARAEATPTKAIASSTIPESAQSPGQAELRPLLSERIRVVAHEAEHEAEAQPVHAVNAAQHGAVLYWMCTAMRAHENPALEVAAREAAALGVALRIATFFLASHSHMNARRLTFALQGAQDVQRRLAELGLQVQVRALSVRSRSLRAAWCGTPSSSCASLTLSVSLTGLCCKCCALVSCHVAPVQG
jgi:DNA photolyase